MPGLTIAVNVSVRQLTHPDFLQHVRTALQGSGLDPRRLVLEVTETALVTDERAASRALGALHRLGVRIALDDFGTGYSSLLYLRRYPISVLKLDRAFVSGIGRSVDDEAICSSVVSLAGTVGMTSIAEGVETSEQAAVLRLLGCQLAQGYLWSPGVALDALPAALERSTAVSLPDTVGKPLGPSARTSDPGALRRILELHGQGASLHTIAAALNRTAVTSPTGRRWTAKTVARHITDPG